MEGRTHRFLAFMLSITMIASLTAFHTLNFKIIWGTIGVQILAIFFYGRASKWKIKETTIKKDKKEGWEGSVTKVHKKYLKNEVKAFTLMFLALLYTCLFADFVPEGRSVSVAMSITSIPSIFAGATFADWDWDFGEGSHRDPLLHSWVIPFSIWAFTMAVIPYEYRYYNFTSAIFCLSYSTHMFSDTVTSTTTGTWNIIKEFFNFSNAPGNIKHFPERWEHPWLFASGVVLCGSFGFTIPRLYGTHGFTWDVSDPKDPYIYILIGIIGISFIIWLGFYLRAQHLKIQKDRTKKKTTKSRAKKESQKQNDLEIYEKRKKKILSVFDDKDLYSSKSQLATAIENKLNEKNIDILNIIDQLREEGLIEYNSSNPRGYRRV